MSAFAGTPGGLSLQRFPDGSTEFSQPIAISAPNDGSGRVFIVERCDDIVIVENGSVLPTPFVSIDAACSSEQGILGLAFDPDYASNGTFYVTYTAPNSDPRLGDANDQVLDVLSRQQYQLAVTVNPGGNPFFAQPLMLRRTMIFGDHDLEAFKAKLQISRAVSVP
jgi:hypothetical protein